MRSMRVLALASSSAVLASTFVGLLAPAAAQAATPKCFGKKPSLVVTQSKSTVKANKHQKVILIKGKNDTVHGANVNSLICDVGTHNKIYGGSKTDKIKAGKYDFVDAGHGKNVVYPNRHTTINLNNGGQTTLVGGKGFKVLAAPAPVVALNGSPSSGYVGQHGLPVSFKDSIRPSRGLSVGRWTMNFGDGTVVSKKGAAPASFSHTYASAGKFVAKLTVVDTQNRAGSGSSTINVGTNPAAPTVGLLANPATGQPGATGLKVTLSPSSNPGQNTAITGWAINFGDGSALATGTGVPGPVEHTYTTPGSHTAILSVFEAQGQMAQATAPVVVIPNSPTSVLTGPSTGALSDAAQNGGVFNAAFSTGGTAAAAGASIASYTLDFGDGSPVQTGTGAPPASMTHAYNFDGTYVSRLVVTDDHGNVSTPATSQVVITAPEVAVLLADHNKVSGVPQAVNSDTLPALDEGYDYYSYYYCWWWLTNCWQGNQTVSFDGSNSAAGTGQQIASWSLDFGDGSPARRGADAVPGDIQHVYLTAGTYTATLTVTDSSGNSRTSTQSITVVPPGSATLSGAPSNGDPSYYGSNDLASNPGGVSWTFTTTAAAGSGATLDSWTMDFGDGATQTGTGTPPATVTHSYSMPGSYETQLQVTDSNGGVGLDYTSVDVYSSATSARLMPSSVKTETDESTYFSIEGSSLGSGSETPSWSLDFGDGTPAWTSSSPGNSGSYVYDPGPHTYATPGVYTATLTVTGSDGVTSTRTAAIDVAGALKDTVRVSPAGGAFSPTSGLTTTVYSAETVGSRATGTKWTVDFGDGTNATGTGVIPATLQHTYKKVGSFWVRETVSDDYGRTLYVWNNYAVQVWPSQTVARLTVETESGARVTSGATIYFDGYGSSLAQNAAWDRWTIDYGNKDSLGNENTNADTGAPEDLGDMSYTPGSYVVTLTAWDDQGTAHVAQQTLDVTDAPTASISNSYTWQDPSNRLCLGGSGSATATLATSAASSGDAVLGDWSVQQNNGGWYYQADAAGHGTPPGSASLTYTSGGWNLAELWVRDDHGGTATSDTYVPVLDNNVHADSYYDGTSEYPYDVTWNREPAGSLLSVDASHVLPSCGATIASYSADWGDTTTETDTPFDESAPITHDYAGSSGWHDFSITFTDTAGQTDTVYGDVDIP